MKSYDHELRLSETNSADDSEGRTWGLEGNLFWYVAGGLVAFVATLLFLFSVIRLTFLASLLMASIPLLFCLIYVFGFRQGKPPGYDMDLLDYWINGRGFRPTLHSQSHHPLQSNVVD